MISIEGKNALITGSSRGVGQQVALGLARMGCNIIVHGRSRKNCVTTLELLENYPVKVVTVHGELIEKASVEEVISQVREQGIQVDILYNNAALMASFHDDIWAHSWEEWTDTFKVNVMAMYSMCSAFIPGMVERGFGRVVNLTSGIMHTPELAPYGASKWAVNKLTDDLAAWLGDGPVKISTLDPGWLRTDMGGENADHPVEAVLPGALAPALIDNDAPNGKFFSAIDHNLRV